MECYLSETIDELRELVRKAKWDLPEPVRTSREEFLEIDNLWNIEIRSTCDQAVQFMGAVNLTIDDGLNRPAAALSRSIHECSIRFHYLSDHEDELPDWFLWQMSHDYHATWIRYGNTRLRALPMNKPFNACGMPIRRLLTFCGRSRLSDRILGNLPYQCYRI